MMAPFSVVTLIQRTDLLQENLVTTTTENTSIQIDSWWRHNIGDANEPRQWEKSWWFMSLIWEMILLVQLHVQHYLDISYSRKKLREDRKASSYCVVDLSCSRFHGHTGLPLTLRERTKMKKKKKSNCYMCFWHLKKQVHLKWTIIGLLVLWVVFIKFWSNYWQIYWGGYR